MTLPADVDDVFRFQIMLHALSSWEGTGENCMIRSDKHVQPMAENRTRTLEYLPRTVLRPEVEVLRTNVWQVVPLLAERFLGQGLHVDALILMDVCLNATDSPKSLWSQPMRGSDSM